MPALTPLIHIDNGGLFADMFTCVTIPIQISPEDFAMGFIYDPATGKLEGLPVVALTTNSITIATRHFSSFFISATRRRALAYAAARDGVVTGFRPGLDDWDFTNYGTFRTSKGQCEGMCLTAMWYYSNRIFSQGGQPVDRSLRLHSSYDNSLYADLFRTPLVVDDNVQGLRPAAAVLYEPPANYGALNDVGEGPGVAYAAAMTPNAAGIEALYGGDFDLQIAHRAGGTAGNSIALGETLVDSGAWAEGNQVDAVATPTGDQFATALVAALNSDPGGPVWAERLSATEVLVWSRRPGDVRSVCVAAFTDGGNAWDQATLSGGMPAREALRLVCGVVRTPTALEITRQRLHFVFGFEPRGVVLQVRSNAGAPVTFDGVVTLSGRRVTVTAATVALAAGQVFQVLVFQ